MATALAASCNTDLSNDPRLRSISRPGSERLGAEITRLSAQIYAASYRLLVLIRAFDEQDGWHQYGLRSNTGTQSAFRTRTLPRHS